ncbi:UNVERIFIED_CONTAM: hypothetical protein ABIC26_004790 [Paenibacillus sp. PvR008]
MEMDTELQDYIQRYQQEDDQECLQLLLVHCWSYVENLIGELRQKGKIRFPFIMSKYQLEVQLPL